LAEAASRAAVFATRDFVGAEAAYAIRNSFLDLDAYLGDPGLRRDHRDEIQREISFLQRNNALASSIPALPNEELGWLEEGLRHLESLRATAFEPFEHYFFGLIWAIRMTKEDVLGLKWHASMGVESQVAIPPDRIVAKVRLPADFDVSASPGVRVEAPAFHAVIAALRASQ
jgi:hypothetical protein